MSGITLASPAICPANSLDNHKPARGGIQGAVAGIIATTPPAQRRGGRALHITRRGKLWYFKIMIDGKRRYWSLKTGDRNLALARAKALASQARNEPWHDIDGVKKASPAAAPTLAQVKPVFFREAPGRGIRDATAVGYWNQLLNVVRKGSQTEIKDAEATSTAALTEDLALDYQSAVLRAAGDDGLARERAQRTVRSALVNARAVFAPWTERIYKAAGLALPASLQGFRKAVLNRALVRTYRLPAAALIERTLREGRALRSTRPDLYGVFLLCYDLGLRAGEAVAVKWDWFAVDASGQRVIEILRRPDFTPKWSKERRVPVSDEVWEHLVALRGEKKEGFVLPAADRPALVEREFAGWMRGLGWDRREFPKAAHELRKLMGSRWFTELGAEVAQAWLGHQNVATTCSFYTALRRQPAPLGME